MVFCSLMQLILMFDTFQIEDLRERLKEKDTVIDKKSQNSQNLTVDKRKLELECTELKDNIDIKERKISVLQRKVIIHCETTPGRGQSKTLLTIDKHGLKIAIKTLFSIAICRQSGDKWQSKTLFLKILDLRSSIVLTFSIATYPVWKQAATSC